MKTYFTLCLFAIANFCVAQNFELPTIAAFGNCFETKVSLYNGATLDYFSTKTYNALNQLTKKTETFSKNLNGPYVAEFTYEYDAKGNNTKVSLKQNNIQQSVILKEYSVAGKLVKETLTKDGSAASATASIAENVLGNNVEKTFLGGNSKEVKQFDKAGNLLKQESIGTDGKVQTSLVNEYNFQGKLTKKTSSDVFAEAIEVTTLTYDASGNLSNEKTLRNGDAFGEANYTYNTQGKLALKIHKNHFNQADYALAYEYDKNGKVTKLSYLTGTQELVTYTTYDYDNFGNKTKESYFDKSNVMKGYKAWEFSCK
jgi:YD repeat-containing protein